MDELLKPYLSASKKLDIPIDLKAKTSIDADKIINSPFTKYSMINNLQDMSYSVKIEPLTFVDERKFYMIVDACYKIYEQMSTQEDPKYTKLFSWTVANIALFGLIFKSVVGKVYSGRDVERMVDQAIRSPYLFITKYMLSGLAQMATAFGPQLMGWKTIGHYTANIYIFMLMLQLITLAIKIYRKSGVKELSQ